jgi:hypothetical protein
MMAEIARVSSSRSAHSSRGCSHGVGHWWSYINRIDAISPAHSTPMEQHGDNVLFELLPAPN